MCHNTVKVLRTLSGVIEWSKDWVSIGKGLKVGGSNPIGD